MSTPVATRPLALRYLKTIGIVNNGYSGRGFSTPCSVALSRDGRIFVMNRGDLVRKAVRVGVVNLDEDYLFEFGNGYGDEDGQFMQTTCIAFDNRDRLHVTDEYLHRISVFDSSGNFLKKWGVHGDGNGQLNGPSGIAFNSEGHAYVVDQRNNRVQKFTGDGEYILQWGQFGEGEGQLNLPWGVAVDSDDNVYVVDWRNDRIQKFSSDGQYLAKFGESGDGDGQFYRPSSVAVDDKGYMYVADWGNQRVQILGPGGSFQVKLRGEATLSKWADEFFASNPDEETERNKSNLTPSLPARLGTPYHVSSQTEPYFWGPVSVALDRDDQLYVVETNRHRVQIYQKMSQISPVA